MSPERKPAPESDGRPAAETSLDRRSVSPLELPRLIGGVLSDIRSIAEGMAVLPRLLDALNAIESRVDTLNDEVTQMRAAVERMGGDVSHVRGGIERVEPHLEEVTRAVHPLRRLTGRARRQDRDAATGEEHMIELDFVEEETES
jgi:hypothetical protein